MPFLLFPLATAFALLLLNRALGRMLPGLYTARFFGLYYLFQAGLVAVILALEPETMLWNDAYPLTLAEATPRLCGCFLVEGLAAFGVSWLLRKPLNRFTIHLPPLTERIRQAQHPLDSYLALLAVLLMLNLFANVEGLFFYFIRTTLDLTFVAAFVAGVRFRQTRCFVRVLWILALTGAATRAVFAGSRSDFLPVLLYGWGVFLSLPTRRARVVALLAVAALLPSFVVLNSFIGSYRLQQGRLGNLGDISAERVSAALSARDQLAVGQRTPLQMVLERLLNHPNAAVVALTPDVIPYRGWANLGAESADNFDVTGLRGQAAIEGVREAWREQEFGLGTANSYGFYSGLKSGVEFSILADGYSRAGAFGVLLYGVLAVLVLLGAEVLLLRKVLAGSADGVLVLTFLLYIALGVFYAYPFFWTVKFLLLRTLGYFLVTRLYRYTVGTLTATEPGTLRL